jgi:hypothetical protein
MGYSPWRDERRNVLAEMARSLIAWLDQHAPLNGLGRCDPDEIEHIARDIGILPRELRILATKRGDAAELLYDRMGILGLDAETLAHNEPGVLRDLQHHCSMCERRKRCVLDLRDRPRDAAWQEYCPNALTLCGLVAEQPEPESLDDLIGYLNAARSFRSQDQAREGEFATTKH